MFFATGRACIGRPLCRLPPSRIARAQHRLETGPRAAALRRPGALEPGERRPAWQGKPSAPRVAPKPAWPRGPDTARGGRGAGAGSGGRGRRSGSAREPGLIRNTLPSFSFWSGI